MLDNAPIIFKAVLAADDRTATGSLLMMLFVMICEWGWIVGLALLSVVWLLRKTKSILAPLFATFAIPLALILLIFSAMKYATHDKPSRKQLDEVLRAVPAGT